MSQSPQSRGLDLTRTTLPCTLSHWVRLSNPGSPAESREAIKPLTVTGAHVGLSTLSAQHDIQ